MPTPPSVAQLSRPATWPRNVRRVVDVAAGLVAFVARLGRERAEGQGKLAAMQATLDAKDALISQQALELDMFRRRFGAMPPRERPHFEPRDRLTILRLMWLNGWSAKDVAKRFVLGAATVHRWLKAWYRKADPGLFFGHVAWNKLSHAVRDLIHDCRIQFPEPEVGTRTIAAQIEKAAVALSCSTVQRVLKEPSPRKSSGAKSRANDGELPPSAKPFHILKPEKINRTWHLDLTVIRVLWFQFHVAALLVGHVSFAFGPPYCQSQIITSFGSASSSVSACAEPLATYPRQRGSPACTSMSCQSAPRWRAFPTGERPVPVRVARAG